MVRILNVLMGLWALYSASIAILNVRELTVQVVLIVLFVLLEAVQGFLLVFAPSPKVELQQPANLVAVFGVVFLTIWAGVNVVRSPLPNPIGAGLLLCGLILSIWSTITLGRRFGLFAEARELCTSGPYRFLNHPMYVGYGLQYLGLALQTTHLTACVFLSLATILQVLRALQENVALNQLRNISKDSPTVLT